MLCIKKLNGVEPTLDSVFHLACNWFVSAANACTRERASREVLSDAQREAAAVIAQDEFPDEPALHLIGRIDAFAEA